MSDVGEPLTGCVMVITADRRKRELASALERRGATVRHAAALSTIPHLDDERLLADTQSVIANPPDVVVATTGIGFRGWVEAADAAPASGHLQHALADARREVHHGLHVGVLLEDGAFIPSPNRLCKGPGPPTSSDSQSPVWSPHC